MKAEHAGLEKGLGDHRYALQVHAAEAKRYREAHPWKARLHDLRVKSDQALAYRAEADTALRAGKEELEKQLEVSQRLNMQALQSLDEARGHAMPQAIETHGIQAERFRQVEAIYQPQKEKQIAQEQAQRKQNELEKQQEREKERQKERERGRGMSR